MKGFGYVTDSTEANNRCGSYRVDWSRTMQAFAGEWIRGGFFGQMHKKESTTSTQINRERNFA